jgi:hypothetical protein
LLVAAIAWSGVWWAMKVKIEASLNDEAGRLRVQGYAVSWSGLKIDGWPFRLHLSLAQPRLADRSGWALAAPDIVGEAMAYAPDRFILAAPDGLTLTRPGKGPLVLQGRAIRASVGALGSPQPRVSFQALDVTLTPGPGGLPGPIGLADTIEAHLQPGPDDRAALLVRIEGASLAQATPLARLMPKGAFGLVWDARLSHLSALHGGSWPAALQAWAAAGGQMTVADCLLKLGPLQLHGMGGPLSVGPDARLSGTLPMTLGAGAGGLFGLSLGGPLAFKDGRAFLGPIPLGRALKVG